MGETRFDFDIASSCLATEFYQWNDENQSLELNIPSPKAPDRLHTTNCPSVIPVDADFAHYAFRADLAVPGLLGSRNHRGQRAGLGLHLASKVFAVAAINAGIAALVILGKNRHGRGIRMPTQLARAALEEHSRGIDGKMRQRIGP